MLNPWIRNDSLQKQKNHISAQAEKNKAATLTATSAEPQGALRADTKNPLLNFDLTNEWKKDSEKIIIAKTQIYTNVDHPKWCYRKQ